MGPNSDTKRSRDIWVIVSILIGEVVYLVSVEGEAEGVLGLDVIVKGPSR